MRSRAYRAIHKRQPLLIFIRVLLASWVLLLASRILLFGEGGTVGAYTSVSLFWLVAAVLITALIWCLFQDGRRNMVEPVLVLAVLVLFCYRGLVTEGPTASVSALLLIAGVGVLMATYLYKLWITANHRLSRQND